MVLLEVTGEHAVEAAVAAALRVKRANASQFVGYLADASLETSGLAGDAVFPRSAARVEEALRRHSMNGDGEWERGRGEEAGGIWCLQRKFRNPE